jgi:hypothetical protein
MIPGDAIAIGIVIVIAFAAWLVWPWKAGLSQLLCPDSPAPTKPQPESVDSLIAFAHSDDLVLLAYNPKTTILHLETKPKN